MEKLLKDIKNCTICKEYLPHGINPVLTIHPKSRILIIGQAPGRIVHETAIPWDDKSGERLRDWLGIDATTFYNPEIIALLPMGFCYPGKGKSGDLPPRKECAPAWHKRLLGKLHNVELTILIGTYAQDYYLKAEKLPTLTQTVKNFSCYLPNYFVLPHPSPRNNIWLKKNLWFKSELLPKLRGNMRRILKLTK